MASTISAGTSAGTAIAIAGDTSGALALQTNNGTTAVTINTSQQVGIGTTSPAYALDVNKGSLGSAARFGYSGGKYAYVYADSQQVYFGSDSACNNSWASNDTSSYLVTYTGGTERMRIDSTGNIYIANTNSQIGGDTARMTFSGAHNSGYFGIAIISTTSTGNQNFINFARGGSQCGYIYSGSTNSTSYLTSSDYRLKEDITPMTGALAKVTALKPVTYKWKQDGTSSQGFIAHELQQFCPEAVSGNKDELDDDGNPRYQGVDTSFLVATLTAAIQELNAKVDAQAATITELQAKVG